MKMKSGLSRAGSLLSVALLLAACATQAPPQYAAVQVPQDFLLDVGAGQGDPFPESEWWQRYGSPTLDRLIQRAELNNPDLSAAAARIARADAELRRSGASLLPSATADTSASRNSRPWAERFSDGGGSSYSLGLRASYELDLWGANASTVEAAAARALASRFEQESVALSLFSEVALGY
ncbi:MAG TPA: TolC family protein, partial [Kiloniellales bacterium]|nr:TolC family protein [Kiloniellales bacterium]